MRPPRGRSRSTAHEHLVQCRQEQHTRFVAVVSVSLRRPTDSRCLSGLRVISTGSLKGSRLMGRVREGRDQRIHICSKSGADRGLRFGGEHVDAIPGRGDRVHFLNDQRAPTTRIALVAPENVNPRSRLNRAKMAPSMTRTPVGPAVPFFAA